MASSEALVLFSLEIAEMFLSIVYACVWSMCSLGPTRPSSRPDEVAKVVVNIWSRVYVPVRSNEYVSRSYELWSKEIYLQNGRV